MLSKSATMMLGLINQKPANAYEIIKILDFMNVKWWYRIADPTVYATLRTLDKNGSIVGVSEQNGNMPVRTVYSITEKGSYSILLRYLQGAEADKILNKYIKGIEKWISHSDDSITPLLHIVTVERMASLAKAELSGTKKLLELLRQNQKGNE